MHYTYWVYYTYMHAQQLMKKQAMNLKELRRVYETLRREKEGGINIIIL